MPSPSPFHSSEEEADTLAFLQCADSMERSLMEREMGGEMEERASSCTLNWLPPCYQSDEEDGNDREDFWGACAAEEGMLEETATEIEQREQECLKQYLDNLVDAV
uniref:Uncharacterized protein n=1 Tax=Hanusia phi TaxID=3032 RepID=A0A7S0F233_9CRYP